jgi:hypothetical protein
VSAPHPTLSPEGRGKNIPKRRRAPEHSGGEARGTLALSLEGEPFRRAQGGLPEDRRDYVREGRGEGGRGESA